MYSDEFIYLYAYICWSPVMIINMLIN